MFAEYPALPMPPTPVDDGSETLQGYGARLVRWLLETDCTATLTLEQLELSAYAATFASVTKGYDVKVYDRLSALRHRLTVAIGLLTVPPAVDGPAGGLVPGKPDVGPMAKLVPPVPSVPPAGAYANAGTLGRRDNIQF